MTDISITNPRTARLFQVFVHEWLEGVLPEASGGPDFEESLLQRKDSEITPKYLSGSSDKSC